MIPLPIQASINLKMFFKILCLEPNPFPINTRSLNLVTKGRGSIDLSKKRENRAKAGDLC